MSDPRPDAATPGALPPSSTVLTRRNLLRAGALTGGGLVAATLAACGPAAAPGGWTYGPSLAPGAAPAGSAPPPSDAQASHAPESSASPAPAPAMVDHDAAALAAVERFLDGEGAALAGAGNQPLEPRIDDGVKVFELTIDEIEHQIDAHKEPIAALGYGGTWPAPRIAVVEGDQVRATSSRTTCPSRPASTSTVSVCRTRWTASRTSPRSRSSLGESFTYEFVGRTPGSHMYHSHHNATDQVGRGLLGAFIVEPKDPAQRYDQPVRRDPGHRLDQQRHAGRLHDQRSRLSGHVADRRDARRIRSSIRFMNEGSDDASLASPRDADAHRRS